MGPRSQPQRDGVRLRLSKVQGQTFNLFILKQLPVVPPARYREVSFGPKTAEQIVHETVLELTCTAQDMAPFARDMGHVDEAGKVLPPFRWVSGGGLQSRPYLRWWL